MEFYTEIPVIDKHFTGNSFLSPLRPDNNPTANYYYTDTNKLKLRDYGISFNGDVFDVISYLTKISIKSSQGFVLLLHKIASDFQIHKYESKEERDILNLNVKNYVEIKSLKGYKVVPRKFNKVDYNYWTLQYGITQDMLRIAKIIPIDELYITDFNGFFYRRYVYSNNNPGYAYYGGTENGVNIWKCYFPFSTDKKKKFTTNKSFIQGEHMLVPAEICVLTKSYKDVLCYKSFGIQAVAVASESSLPDKDFIFKLKSYYNVVISNMDYDTAGIKLSNKLKKIYNIQPVMFTQGKYGSINYGVKDFSDFIKLYGREKALQLLIMTIGNYREDLDNINIINYNILKDIK